MAEATATRPAVEPVAPPPAAPAEPVSPDVENYFQGQVAPPVPAELTTPTTTPAAEPTEEFPALREASEAAAAAASERAARETTARIEREAEARQAQVRATQEGQRFQQNYQGRVDTTRTEVYNALIGLGGDATQAQAFAERIANRLNEHHQDGLKLFEPAAYATAAATFDSQFNQSVFSALETKDAREAYLGTTEKPRGYSSVTEALPAVVEAARVGYVTKSEAKAQAKTEVLKYQKWLEDNKRLVGTRSVRQSVTGSPPGTGNKTFATRQDAEAAFVAGDISMAEMKAIRADKSIPYA